MIDFARGVEGTFCWLDLAATDAATAKLFYARVFGWTSSESSANGGSFTRLLARGQDVGSLYQLRGSHLEGGVPSHWTPYVRVDHAVRAARRVNACGGTVIVPPFVVQDIARIALFRDSVGALVGLWEPLQTASGEIVDG